MAEHPETVTVAGLGIEETLTVAAPADWHDRIRALSRWTGTGPTTAQPWWRT